MFKITDLLDRCHVIPGFSAQNKAALLEELARRAAVALKLDENSIVVALNDRERLGSTGVGHGVAIPHARLPVLARSFGMFVRVEPPVDYDAIDGEPVDLVFLLLTPADAGSVHLSSLAGISRRLRDPATVAALRAGQNAKELFAAFAEG
ncbi:MAG: PTS sugar transporter subunit IIA [Rhodospirillaceae bacterium]